MSEQRNQNYQSDFVLALTHSPSGNLITTALHYLLTRGFSLQMIHNWGLGYCSEKLPDEYSVLYKRITFPIYDWRGRLLSFAGRIVQPPGVKYLGMSDTPIFQKFRHVYGLDKALPTIIESEVVVVVEGYTDVIACHEFAGMYQTVGLMGIAFTEWHYWLLSRWANKIVVLMDGDKIGRIMTERIVKQYSGDLAKVIPVYLPMGQDPFDYVFRFRGGLKTMVGDALRNHIG